RPLRCRGGRPRLRDQGARALPRRTRNPVHAVHGFPRRGRSSAMTLLALPQPYDFDISTERFRAFGPDLANLWHEGGLHRAVEGREVRIEAAPGGVEVDPLDNTTEPVVRKLLGLEFDLDPFYAFAAGD